MKKLLAALVLSTSLFGKVELIENSNGIKSYCIDGYELVQVIDNSDTIKICRQNSDSYEEVSLDKLEPFTGSLPSFIKD